MWISGLFAMATKYTAEAVLGLTTGNSFRTGAWRGAMYYLKNGVHSPCSLGCLLFWQVSRHDNRAAGSDEFHGACPQLSFTF